MNTYVLVHGGWVGGWFWQRVARLMRGAGHEVYTPTLTGLGERAHLAGPEVGLKTHAEDVLGVLRYEDLSDVILVGHSSGGAVITQAAEGAARRLAHLVYFDAFVPADGESLADLLGPQMMAGFEELARTRGDGWRLPFPFPLEAIGVTEERDAAWVVPKLADQPLKTATEPVRLTSAEARAIPRTFVYCSERPMGLFDAPAARARAGEGGWRYRELAAPHAAIITEPRKVAEALLEIS